MKNGGGQNARATGGPGILPETNYDYWISRTNTNEPPIPSRIQS
jgi:hypothetical protein